MNYVKSNKNHVNISIWQATYRELHTLFCSVQFWICLLAITAILTVAGPFGTLNSLSIGERFSYWGLVALTTFSCGVIVGSATWIVLNKYTDNLIMILLVSGFVNTLAILILLVPLNSAIFEVNFFMPPALGKLALNCLIISYASTSIYALIVRDRKPSTDQTSKQPSPLVARLPRELGANILHMTSQDHYVEVVTDRGSNLVLMRFSDAVNEVTPETGARIHRAHWVSFSAIERLVRENGKMSIETVDGKKLPVSRTYQKAVKEAVHTSTDL